MSKKWQMLPVVSMGAEYLAMGYLMRRNILAYKAPPNNEGYDIVCIHQEPRKITKQIRVQVKSRYQTDCNRSFFIREETVDSFDYLIGVFLNIGYFFQKKNKAGGKEAPEILVFPREVVRSNIHKVPSGLDRLKVKDIDLEPFRNEVGLEQIAKDLRIEYPTPAKLESGNSD